MDKTGQNQMNDQSFYNKISQVALKDVIDFLEHNNTEVTLKVHGKYVKSNINSKKNEKQLGLLKFGHDVYSNEPITCIFQINDELYFFTSIINDANSDCEIEIPSEIYQLQRRNDYRIPMPIGVLYKCKIISVNKNKTLVDVEIRDISLGGCLISIPGLTSEYKENDVFEIFLQLGRFEFQNLSLTIKHIKFVEIQNNTLIGSSFSELESAALSQIQGLMMHLDRVKRRKAD